MPVPSAIRNPRQNPDESTRISHKMTANGYSLFVSMQNNKRTNAHEYKEKGTINQPPHRSAILRFHFGSYEWQDILKKKLKFEKLKI